jgi:hypothetical protein
MSDNQLETVGTKRSSSSQDEIRQSPGVLALAPSGAAAVTMNTTAVDVAEAHDDAAAVVTLDTTVGTAAGADSNESIQQKAGLPAAAFGETFDVAG